MSAEPDHWSRHAHQWASVGSPLRPCAEDIEVAAGLVRESFVGQARKLTALVLGVTPELATMNWPEETRVLAADRSIDMIRSVWPGVEGQAMCGNWLQLPIHCGHVDCIVGDGCTTVLDSPARQDELASELARLLPVSGCLVLRLFVRPPERESPEMVVDQLLGGRIGSFHAFKWRLAMALVSEPEGAVAVGEIWRFWCEMNIEPRELADRLSWPVEEIATIEAYRNASACYSFPTLEQVRAAFRPWFVEKHCLVPDYELGERCPTLHWSRRVA